MGIADVSVAQRIHVQITIGVACATLPTSSSFCIIFLMRALETPQFALVIRTAESLGGDSPQGIWFVCFYSSLNAM